MKKKIILVAVVLIVAAFAIVTLSRHLKNENNKKREQQIMESEQAQVMVLSDIYNDFLSNFNINEMSLALDESCLKNFITGVEFSQENKELLKQIESTIEVEGVIYTLSFSYNQEVKNINVVLLDENRLNINEKIYELYVAEDKIQFRVNETI